MRLAYFPSDLDQNYFASCDSYHWVISNGITFYNDHPGLMFLFGFTWYLRTVSIAALAFDYKAMKKASALFGSSAPVKEGWSAIYKKLDELGGEKEPFDIHNFKQYKRGFCPSGLGKRQRLTSCDGDISTDPCEIDPCVDGVADPPACLILLPVIMEIMEEILLLMMEVVLPMMMEEPLPMMMEEPLPMMAMGLSLIMMIIGLYLLMMMIMGHLLIILVHQHIIFILVLIAVVLLWKKLKTLLIIIWDTTHMMTQHIATINGVSIRVIIWNTAVGGGVVERECCSTRMYTI